MSNHPIKQKMLTQYMARLRPNLSEIGPENMQPNGVASEAMLAKNQKSRFFWYLKCGNVLPNQDAWSLSRA